jgi:hypothetical protein
VFCFFAKENGFPPVFSGTLMAVPDTLERGTATGYVPAQDDAVT